MIDVCHFLDAGANTLQCLWGKERVVHTLMHEQRASGLIEPRLVVFTETLLSTVLASEGFRVQALESSSSRLPHRSLPALIRYLQHDPQLVLHTHGYKADVVARLARACGAPMAGLVSTCHGWTNETFMVRAYDELDRATSFLSDFATAPDPAMVARLWGTRRAFVRNGVAGRPAVSQAERLAGRARFGWPEGEFVVGMLGRLSSYKGALNFADAAELSAPRIVWAVAGSGPLQAEIEARCSDRLRYVGYVEPATDFLAAIDVYVQPSLTEAQSMSLLEAMRAGLPIVATRVGATEDAVRHEREALLVDSAAPDQLAAAVERVHSDLDLRTTLAANARRRFEDSFDVRAQHEEYLALYRKAMARKPFSVPA